MINKKYLIYLDLCCLNRPFDDQTQTRIKRESEAVIEIINYCKLGQWELVNSAVLELEISKMSDSLKKDNIKQYLFLAKRKILVTENILNKAEELTLLGIKKFDALHLACAENNVDIFLTTDDRLLNKCVSYNRAINVKVSNPVSWLIDVSNIGVLKMTPVELQRKGFQVLVDSLGIADAIRFIKLYDNGSGDYTKERHQWLDKFSMDDIVNDLQKFNDQNSIDIEKKDLT
ncbi:MAG: hypothetical protein IGQ45_12740 [Cyanobacterium sp. T60_A2020_053]|nr:hypothetical protein [Cyanobacterium sp. T60_A2020_053]